MDATLPLRSSSCPLGPEQTGFAGEIGAGHSAAIYAARSALLVPFCCCVCVVAERAVQALGLLPLYAGERRVFDVLLAASPALVLEYLGLEQAVDRFGEGIVLPVAHGGRRR